MQVKENVQWIAWETHRRTLEISAFLGIIPTIYDDTKKSKLARHIRNIFKTGIFIHSTKPCVLIVQNPSIVLTVFALFLRRIYNYRLIVDCHNVSIFPERKLLKLMGFIYRLAQKHADLTLVTNNNLAQIISKYQGKPFVLPDRVPRPKPTTKLQLRGKYNVAYICTFKKDEPFNEVIEAAKEFDDDVFFYITGDLKKCPRDIINNLSHNVIFTNFLEEEDYWDLLSSVHLIIDLTNRQGCLVCGAYEAVALGCPMILSNTAALKSHFSKGAIYTENTRDAIVDAVRKGLANHSQLKKEISVLKNELSDNWNIIGSQLKSYIFQKDHFCVN